MIERVKYLVRDLSKRSENAVPLHPNVADGLANCVGSALRTYGEGDDRFVMVGALHAPALDIDHPCTLVESSTPGHFHLYIDKAMPWEDYVRLLDVMAEVGLLEPGYVAASKRDGATILRLPGVTK